MATTQPARWARATVRVPIPAPTSTTTSWGERDAASRMVRRTRSLTRKCCPQRFEGRIPKARNTSRVARTLGSVTGCGRGALPQRTAARRPRRTPLPSAEDVHLHKAPAESDRLLIGIVAEVDPHPLNGAPGVSRDRVPVPLHVEPRPQGDDGGVHGHDPALRHQADGRARPDSPPEVVGARVVGGGQEQEVLPPHEGAPGSERPGAPAGAGCRAPRAPRRGRERAPPTDATPAARP